MSGYLTNYAAAQGWRIVPAWLDGREVLAGFRDARDERPSYFIELTVRLERIEAIRDFRYVPYIAVEAGIELVA